MTIHIAYEDVTSYGHIAINKLGTTHQTDRLARRAGLKLQGLKQDNMRTPRASWAFRLSTIKGLFIRFRLKCTYPFEDFETSDVAEENVYPFAFFEA